MSSVSSSPALDGPLHCYVSDPAFVNVEPFSFSIRDQVLQELETVGSWFMGPSTFGGLEGFALGVSSDTASVLEERDDLLVLEDGFVVSNSLFQIQSSDSPCHIVDVFVVGTHVIGSALSNWERLKIRETYLWLGQQAVLNISPC